MSTLVAAPKPSKAATKTVPSNAQASRAARFRSKAFTRELTEVFHAAKLRALDAAKPKA